MPDPLIHVFPSAEAMSEAAARRTIELIGEVPADEPFAIALSGGSTPKLFHECLAGRLGKGIDWSRIHLFWGDERFVPMNDPDSNYRMAQQTLMSHVPIPEENVHPVRTHGIAPSEAAARYDFEIRSFLQAYGKHGLDLVVLGVGDDGHTASLFPGTPVLDEQQQWVVAMEAPSYAPIRDRVTMTLPLLNRSRHVIFLAAGEKKAGPLAQIRDRQDAACPDVPAACVRAMVTLEWFVDEAAYGT